MPRLWKFVRLPRIFSFVSSNSSYQILYDNNNNNNDDASINSITRIRVLLQYFSEYFFRLTLIIGALIVGGTLHFRTTNMWALKNLGDSFLHKQIGQRPIVIGAFHRPPSEQNVGGAYAMIQFVGDSRKPHRLFCRSEESGKTIVRRALIQRIHAGKRAANDICSWSGHLAECEISNANLQTIWLSTSLEARPEDSLLIDLEVPLRASKKHPLVVCVAPMYTYTEWQIMVTGIETWLALGATLFVFPIQSASNDTYTILKAYEEEGKVLIRHWSKWPILSDTNPNGLVLSRGIEESHVNCLHFVKPIADMVAFTDIDDILMPVDPLKVRPNINVELLHNLFNEHPRAGSFLFEHRDVQFVLPPEERVDGRPNSLALFNFEFLHNSQWKTSCKVWRMKTRVVVNASRVDSVNMHETGIHRFGHTQVRVPCRQAHFYHLRHSYKNIALNEWPIKMDTLVNQLNTQWQQRIDSASFQNNNLSIKPLIRSSIESLEDFDRCMSAINEEHWTRYVSRCLTPHVCFTKLQRHIDCVASLAGYAFAHSTGDYLSVWRNASFVKSETNCEAPLPHFLTGNHFYLP